MLSLNCKTNGIFCVHLFYIQVHVTRQFSQIKCCEILFHKLATFKSILAILLKFKYHIVNKGTSRVWNLLVYYLFCLLLYIS